MKEYPVHHIMVIMRMACAKAATPHTRPGLRVIADELLGQEGAEEVSQKYLHESIMLPLTKALQEGKNTLRLTALKIERLCHFIEYDGYNSFAAIWRKLEQAVPVETQFEKCRMIWHRDDDRIITPKFQSVFFPNQQTAFDPPLLLSQFDDSRLEQPPEKTLNILVISDWPNDAVNSLISPSKPNILPIWAEWEEADLFEQFPSLTRNNWLELADLSLTIQYLQLRTELGTDDAKSTSGLKTGNVYITDSGAVFLGDVHVNGEYIASRDMNITINNK